MHEKGIAFDFNLPRFAGEFNAADWTRWTWLAENAHKYGLCNLGNFSNRPYINAAEARAAGNPSAELWHWSVGCR